MCESLPSNPLLSIDRVITNSCTSPHSMNWLSIHVMFHCSITSRVHNYLLLSLFIFCHTVPEYSYSTITISLLAP